MTAFDFPTAGATARQLAHTLAGAVAIAACTAGAAHAQVVTYADRTLFQAAAPAATNSINFERGLATGTGTGFLPTFTEAGFVTFRSGGNYQQQIADGFNLGQGANDVYVSQAFNKSFPTADITFGDGVLSFGFDFKNTSNGPSSAGLVPQSFTFNLFAGASSLGNFVSTTLAGGNNFTFLGFTSTTAVTGMTIVATVPGASPNLDIALDNFAVATPVPEPAPAHLAGMGLAAIAALRLCRRRAA